MDISQIWPSTVMRVLQAPAPETASWNTSYKMGTNRAMAFTQLGDFGILVGECRIIAYYVDNTIKIFQRRRNRHELIHSGWTPFHPMYENSTLCTKWFVHQANTAGTFIVHQANAAGAFIVHQGNVVEHFGSYIKFTHCVIEARWCTYGSVNWVNVDYDSDCRNSSSRETSICSTYRFNTISADDLGT